MAFPIYIVDAFTTGNNDLFTGGPAAVVLLNSDDEIADSSKLKLAKSMNISQTAFVSMGWTRLNKISAENLNDANTLRRTLRWFTPTEEVPLCGHATEASVKALVHHYQKNQKNLKIERIEFETLHRGVLTASISTENQVELITISLPANPTIESGIVKTTTFVPFLKTLLGASFDDPVEAVQEIHESPSQKNSLLVRLKQVVGESPRETLLRVQPNFEELLEVGTGPLQLRIITVTIKADFDSSEDFYSRVFTPFFGIAEDPVCGTAHTLLLPYWSNELKMVGEDLQTLQLSSRGGKLRGAWKASKVTLTGTARVVVEGQLMV
ncbi:unnamed protein product [Allacma fusca]|uniref:Phenazine biosynthesis PhzC/PhzF protein n=1 Tax=Allacma fusca TaxID=39272 RepID=A0A8J2NLS8_9HEXA|nr:unnamed protein product [Allacma fusca]